MQKRLFLFLAASTIVTLHCFAQSVANNQPPANSLFRNIPPDATSVYQFNLPVITSKISWQDLTGIIPLAKLAAANPASVALLKDPALAGLDMNKDIFITYKKATYDSVGYATLIVHLIDSAKFRAALRKEISGLRSFTIPNKNKIRLAGKDHIGAAWTRNLAVLVLVTPSIEETIESVKKTPDTHPVTPNYALTAVKQGLIDIEGFDGSFYTTDPVFTTGFSDDAAIHLWTTQGEGLSSFGKKLGNPFGSLKHFIPENESASRAKTLTTIRLEDGRITIASSTVATPELEKIYTKLNSRPLNMELQSRIPPGNILGLVNVRFDPLLVNDLLNKFGLRNKVDSAMRAKGLPLDTVLSAFRGDLQLVCMEPVSDGGKPQFPLYFVTTVRDSAAFAKVAASIKSMSDSAGVDSVTGKSRNPLAKLNSSYTLQNNILVISGSKAKTDGWFSNTEMRNTSFLNDRIKDNPMSILIDFKTIARFVESMSKGKEIAAKDQKILDLLHSIDKLEVTGGEVRNGKVESFVELKLINSSPNSVANFIKMLH